MVHTTARHRKATDKKPISWLGLLLLVSPFVSFASLGLSTGFLLHTLHRLDNPTPIVVAEVDDVPNQPEEKPLASLPVWANQLDNSLASRIVKYMISQGYQVDTKPNEYNIIYIEGMNLDGSLNDDRPNVFNDLRLVIEFVEEQKGQPKIVGLWEATTEPGWHYTFNPLNAKGAARIQFGQYKAWQMGLHGKDLHVALEQAAPIPVYRDLNQDFMRTGDELDIGEFDINQHWGYDHPVDDVYTASAGCLVGRTWEGHQAFMDLLKQDRRYQADQQYVFSTTIISGDDLVKQFAQ